jgi:hypothetical protein
MASDISTDALIWWSAFGPPLVIGFAAFAFAHFLEVLSPSLGEEA